jgi:hypothetical protein
MCKSYRGRAKANQAVKREKRLMLRDDARETSDTMDDLIADLNGPTIFS